MPLFRSIIALLMLGGLHAAFVAGECWNAFPKPYETRRALACSIRIGRSLVSLGGEQQTRDESCCFHEPTANMESIAVSSTESVDWVSLTAIPVPVRGASTCTINKNSVVVSPSANDVTTAPSSQGSSQVFVIDFDADLVQPTNMYFLPDLPANLSRTALFTDYDDNVFILGGVFNASNTPTKMVFMLPKGGSQWIILPATFPRPVCDCAPAVHLHGTVLLCTDCVAANLRNRSHLWKFDYVSRSITLLQETLHLSPVISLGGSALQQFAVFVTMEMGVAQPVNFYWDLELNQWTNVSTDYFSQARGFGSVFASVHRMYYAGGRVRDNVTGAFIPELSKNIDFGAAVPAVAAFPVRQDREFATGAPIAIEAPIGSVVRLSKAPRCLTPALGTNDSVSLAIPGKPLTQTGNAVLYASEPGLAFVCVASSSCVVSRQMPCPAGAFTNFGQCMMNGCCWDELSGNCYNSITAAEALARGQELYYQEADVSAIYVTSPTTQSLPWWLVLVLVGLGLASLIAVVAVVSWCRSRSMNKVVSDVVEQYAGVTSKYEFVKRIGSGGFGTVFLVKKRQNGNEYALKYIPCSSDEDRSLAMKEFELLRSAQGHRGMVKIHDMFLNWDEEGDYGASGSRPTKPPAKGAELVNPLIKLNSRFLCLVMTYCPEGDLSHYVFREWREGRQLREDWLLTVLADALCDVLEYLHTRSPPIVHRDLKPENVLLVDNKTHVVITDFGLACEYEKAYMTTRTGSLQYVAPECWNRHYTPAVDMWAVGCILYASATGRVSAENARVMFNDAKDKRFHRSIRDDLTALGYSPHFCRIVLGLLQVEPAKRLTAPKVRELIRGPPTSGSPLRSGDSTEIRVEE